MCSCSENRIQACLENSAKSMDGHVMQWHVIAKFVDKQNFVQGETEKTKLIATWCGFIMNFVISESSGTEFYSFLNLHK